VTTRLSAWQISRTRRLAVMTGLAFLMAAAVESAVPAAAATTHTVVMDGTRFIPETLTVKRGDRSPPSRSWWELAVCA